MTPVALDKLAHAVAGLVRDLPQPVVAALLDSLEAEHGPPSVLGLVTQPATVAKLRSALQQADAALPGAGHHILASMLRAARASERLHSRDESLELVWTGPNPPKSALFRTEQTLLALIGSARRSLLVVTYAAYKVESVRAALRAAAERGARVDLVLEQSEEDGGKVSLSPITALLTGTAPSLHVYVWPRANRLQSPEGAVGSLHAKCATADDEALLVSSANLTAHALELNMELGVLVRGGDAPRRVREHFEELIRRGVLHDVGDAGGVPRR